MWTSDDALRALSRHGYRPMSVNDSSGQPELLLFSRGYDEPFMDQVSVRGEDDATACRRRLEDGIDLLGQQNVVWSLDGSLVDVVDELLFRLPRPGEVGAPRLIIPTPGTLWLPPGARSGANM